jgi:transposase InsO family protein
VVYVVFRLVGMSMARVAPGSLVSTPGPTPGVDPSSCTPAIVERTPECYHRESFPTRARAQFAVADYIEMSYNRQRLHSSLGYRTPAEVLTDHEQRQAA